MNKKLLLILLLSLTFINTVNAEVLVSTLNNPITFSNPVSNISLPCYTYELICVGQDDSNAKTGQMILIEDNFNYISSIQLVLKRDYTYNYYSNYSTFLVKVYKSTNSNPNNANLYLWDTAIFDITHDTDQFLLYTFNFDYNLPVYSDDGNTKILNYLWVELQEIDPIVTPSYAFSEIHYGILFTEGENYYPEKANIDISLYFNQYGIWKRFDAIYADKDKYGDLAFTLLGQFKIPSTPVPTPYIIKPNNPLEPIPEDCTFEDFFNNLCEISELPDDTYVPTEWDFNFSDFINNSNTSCPDCIGNESIDIPKGIIDNDKSITKFLKLFGYCNDKGCSIYDIIDMLYDMSTIMFIISVIAIYFKLKIKK